MNSIELNSIGKMYKLFDNTADRIADAFGFDNFKFWDKSQKYKEFWALRDINLKIKQGERLGIIGRNGAGKSTLLKIITGSIQQTEGHINVKGKVQALMQLGTGFHPEFTGLENIRTSLAYNGIDKRKVRDMEEDIIDFSELEDYINQPVKYYSAGMYSRLAFAVSTVLEPEILIIDEVLGAGDAAFVSKCSERMKKLTTDTGATVLFVSHSMESVLEICDNAILIEKGQISSSGTALDISKIYSKKIRDEEELRLRAKEFKVRKRDLKNIISSSEALEIIMFRFCCDTPHPKEKHKIYSCSLDNGENEFLQLILGAPMDNDAESPTKIIDDSSLMDWGKSERDNIGYFRYYHNNNGKNCHAPFCMAVPKHFSLSNILIKVSSDIVSQELVYLEQWCSDRYVRLGALKPGFFEQSFALHYGDVPQGIDTVEEDIVEDVIIKNDESNLALIDNPSDSDATHYHAFEETNSIYGNRQAIIESVDILNKDNLSRRTFYMGEELKFDIQIVAKNDIPNFTMVVNILNSSGKCISQVFCNSHDLNMPCLKKNESINIRASYAPLRLGAGEYMVSIGMFKECDLSSEAENEAYCIVDRALFFNVKRKEQLNKEMGQFAHECKWEFNKRIFTFDATSL